MQKYCLFTFFLISIKVRDSLISNGKDCQSLCEVYLIAFKPYSFVLGIDTDLGYVPLIEDFTHEFGIKIMSGFTNFCSWQLQLFWLMVTEAAFINKSSNFDDVSLKAILNAFL